MTGRGLEEADADVVREVLEYLAQPWAADGRQPDQSALERPRIGPEQVTGARRRWVVSEDAVGHDARCGDGRYGSGKAGHSHTPNGSGTGYADAAGPAGVGASHTACKSEQSSILLATGKPQASQAMLGPSAPSRPQQ
ncbi:hypothetical protein ADK74_16695 [Streptomyces decoyicus]|nr:hypothetical protein ADK74_16695 [Streptomyces decoyicus]